MADPTVRIPGLGRLRRALAQLDQDLAELPEADAKAAQLIAAQAASRAPRRSGRLAASGRASRGSVTFTAAYAAPIHYGWPARGIPARPYALDAAEATRPAWEAAYQAEVDKQLGRVSGTY